jgi:hypothetical protein
MTQTVENDTSPIPDGGPGKPGKTRRERGNRPQKGTQATEEQPKPARTASPVRKDAGHKRDHLVVGGEPRAHLLPPEVLSDRRAAVLRRRLGFGVIALVAVVALGILGAGSAAVSAQAKLAESEAATQSLLKQELGFVKVRKVQTQVDLVKTAQQVGASTEINWMKYLQEVQATLPGNVAITGVNIDSSTPIELFAQPTASLQGPRVATIVFTAKSSSLPLVPSWLDALKTLPGYADALPGSVNLDSSSGSYTVNITMHVNEKAFANRFSPKSEK